MPVSVDLQVRRGPHVGFRMLGHSQPPAHARVSHPGTSLCPMGRYGGGYTARMRLLRGWSSTSASPSLFITGGTYMAKRPPTPFFTPSQPPPGSPLAPPQA